jgi:hypothetical protein
MLVFNLFDVYNFFSSPMIYRKKIENEIERIMNFTEI